MKPLLLALALLLLVPPIDADGARWERKRVPVYDFTSGDFRAVVAAQIENFNRQMPPRAPRLVYHPMPATPCVAVDWPRGGISVCVGEDVPNGEVGASRNWMRRGHIIAARIYLHPRAPDPPWTVCHELLHTLTGIPDDYSRPEPDTSCVHGWLDHPGPFDVAYAKKVYRDRDSGPKKHRKHR